MNNQMTLELSAIRPTHGDVIVRFGISEDATIDEVMNCLRGFLVALGYAAALVDEAVPPR